MHVTQSFHVAERLVFDSAEDNWLFPDSSENVGELLRVCSSELDEVADMTGFRSAPVSWALAFASMFLESNREGFDSLCGRKAGVYIQRKGSIRAFRCNKRGDFCNLAKYIC
jgi:hypothetical protein